MGDRVPRDRTASLVMRPLSFLGLAIAKCYDFSAAEDPVRVVVGHDSRTLSLFVPPRLSVVSFRLPFSPLRLILASSDRARPVVHYHTLPTVACPRPCHRWPVCAYSESLSHYADASILEYRPPFLHCPALLPVNGVVERPFFDGRSLFSTAAATASPSVNEPLVVHLNPAPSSSWLALSTAGPARPSCRDTAPQVGAHLRLSQIETGAGPDTRHHGA